MNKPDYMTLKDGRRVRVELNMNSIGNFASITGKELFDLSGKPDMIMMRTIAWCAVCEGEACDGKEFNDSEIAFGRLVGFGGINEFGKILARQVQTSEQKKSKPLKSDQTKQ
jgi:hypothetical protein